MADGRSAKNTGMGVLFDNTLTPEEEERRPAGAGPAPNLTGTLRLRDACSHCGKVQQRTYRMGAWRMPDRRDPAKLNLSLAAEPKDSAAVLRRPRREDW